MHLGVGSKFARVALAIITTISITIVACTGPTVPPPPGGQGPQFLINSPQDGGLTAGTFFFSVQPLDASSVSRVEFEVDGVAVGSDSSAADGFRVAVAARDYAAGEIELQATVVGTNGRSRTLSVSVENVPSPPSSTTVGADGAVLATARGSTLGIRPGDAVGANVSFAERTQEEVLAATGVDYAALGVTFLGAQEVASDVAIEQPSMVSSADFASFVQPGQAVVNYRIAPDANGDGVGELVVVNTASVAGDDVISDPVPQLQLGGAEVTTSAGTTRLRTLQGATLSGPPGARIHIDVQGLNPISIFGNRLVWESSVNGQVYVVPGIVAPDSASSSTSTISVPMPPLPAGAATLTIFNLSSGLSVGPIDVLVEPAPSLERPATEVIDELFVRSIGYLGSLAISNPGEVEALLTAVAELETARDRFAQIDFGEFSAEEFKYIEDLAGMIENSGLLADLDPAAQSRGQGFSAQYTSSEERAWDYIGFMASVGAIVSLLGFFTLLSLTGATLLAAVGIGVLIGVFLTTAAWFVCKLISGGTCFGVSDPLPDLSDLCRSFGGSGPGDVTGMGAALESGGSGCGNVATERGVSAVAPGDVPGVFEGAQQALGGQVVIKIFVGGGSLPFTAMAGPGGTFFFPIIPEGEPFTAVATDTSSDEVRTFEGIGPALGESVLINFNFLGGSPGLPPIAVDANTAGTLELDATDLYSFVGTAGQLITVGTQGASDFVESYKLDLLGPISNTDLAPAVGSGPFYSETGVVALPDSGSYTLSVASNFSASGAGSGDYQVGLSEITEPTAITLGTSPTTVNGEQTVYGDRHFYSFTAQAGDLHKFSLSLPNGSLFNAELNLLAPGPEPFYDRTNLLGSGTFVTDTKPVAVTLPFVVPESGEYILEIERGSSSGPISESLGAWSLSVLTPDPATAVAVGNTINGSIGLPGEIDMFTFTATAGQMVDFGTDGLDAEVDQVNWSVSAPDGSVIFDEPLFTDPGAFSLPQTGVYTVLVGSDNDAGTGAYTLLITAP